MIRYKCFVFSILFFCLFNAGAQTARTIDSLKNEVLSAESETKKTLALCEYAKALIQNKPDSAFYFAKQAYELANENNFKWGKAHALFAMGSVKQAETKGPEAINYYEQALAIFKEFKDIKVIASMYNNIGLAYFAIGDYPKALTNYSDAIKLYKQDNNLQGEAASLGNIGMVYYNDGNYEKSFEYDSLAMLLDQKTNNQIGIAIHLGNMGNAYMFRASVYKSKGMTKEMESMYKRALEYLTFSYEVNEKINNKENMALQIGNMANLYYDMGDIKKTIEYYDKALKICEETDNKIGMSRQYGNMGWVFFEAKEYEKAIEYTKKAIDIMEGATDLQLKCNWYDNLTGIYEAMGDYKSAYQMFQQFILLRDSIHSVDKARKTLEAQMNIEFERKEETARLEQAKQAIIRNGFIIGFILMLIMAVIVFRGYRNKKKANKEISEQKDLVEQKNKEITDSIRYAKRIQNAHLPSKEYISKKLSELKNKS